MRALHYLIAGLRPAFPSVANRTAIPLFVVGAMLVFVQPCAALSFEFQETGSQAMPHPNAPATLLANGQVLIEGGEENFAAIPDAEIYDPRNGTWTAAGSLNVGRRDHTSILLRKGKVLIVGGQSADSASTELGSRVQQ